MSRPFVQVQNTAGEKVAEVKVSKVFSAPIRADVMHSVHSALNKNKRQAQAVSFYAGMHYSAQSWGTGRAVARIPRVQGSGTHAAGAGAYGNMCRGGHMYSPLRTWRKWHVAMPLKQRRYAVASAVAATAIPALVMARGHRISEVQEVPLVVEGIESIKNTKEAVAALKALGAFEDVEKAKASKKINSGKGKYRNRRYTQRRGPLVIYEKDEGVCNAFRNLAGVELCRVDALNLLKLAPGAHFGRFCIWSKAAFEKLDTIYGEQKTIPQACMKNTDMARLINSNEIQSVLNAKKASTKPLGRKRNPLRNKSVMAKLNPYSKVLVKAAKAAQEAAKAKRV
eukprot:TRINITY_DN763_c0_g1_i1.p2 TRINITY_DN763_c0_g1~~TRINITY_DN763_c0_g1_i1.p2  ORF type:complete len:346 (-),score=65.63 TRINITY_DN763_c0_g1_i1:76-1092(-)